MSDEQPVYPPDRKPAPQQPTPGVNVWELRKDGRMLACEFRDNARAGAGIDVQILEGDGWPRFSKRCADRRGAEFVAESYRRGFLKDGWTDPLDPPNGMVAPPEWRRSD